MKIISVLTGELAVSEQEILSILLGASKKYKVYSIPKRTHGIRLIAQPTKKVKVLQRAYVDMMNFPIHSNSVAYRKGYSIKDNAQFHASNPYLLKMDLSNFFNSITPKIFWGMWQKLWDLPEPLEKHLIENLLFWNIDKGSSISRLVLSVGAPSSPIISNFCLHEFDELITKHCISRDIYYTRYADDMTFSTKKRNVLFEIPSFVKSLLYEVFGSSISVNYNKTVFSSRAHNRHVTGITLTNDGEISLGRERKRYIKHLVNEYRYNKLNSEDFNYLKGILSFSKHIEPKFVRSLINKYGEDVITSISSGDLNET